MKRSSIFLLALVLFALASGQAQAQLDYFRRQIQLGYYTEVLPDLQRYVETNPRVVDGWILLGEANLGAGNNEPAEVAAKKAVSLDDESVGAYIILAKSQIALGRATEAFRTLRKGLKEKPNNPMLLNQYGYALLAVDSTDRAIVMFTRAKEADPENPVILSGLADAYMKQGVSAMAVTLYEKAVEKDSLNIEILAKLARVYIMEKRYGEAGQVYQSVLGLDSTNTTALLDLGRIYFAARQYGNSARLLGKYLDAKPGKLDVMLLHMDALFYNRQNAEALAAAEKALAVDPKSARALRTAARTNFIQKNFPASADAFARLSAVDTLSVEEEVLFGRVYQQMKSDSLAAVHFENAVERDTSQSELYGELGAMYMGMRRYDVASSWYQKRFTLDPSSTSSYVNYALCNLALSNWEEARGALRTAIALKADYLPAHLYLARCLMQMDSTREARKEYEEVIRLGNGSEDKWAKELAEAHGTVGFSHLVDKRFPQALEELNRSIKLKDDNPQTRLWRAQTYALMGKKDEACKEYKIVVKLDPKSKDGKKGLELLGC